MTIAPLEHMFELNSFQREGEAIVNGSLSSGRFRYNGLAIDYELEVIKDGKFASEVDLKVTAEKDGEIKVLCDEHVRKDKTAKMIVRDLTRGHIRGYIGRETIESSRCWD